MSNNVAVSPFCGTVSVRMYSVWTGRRPGGGVYCKGNPGDGSTVVRYQRNAASQNARVRPAIHTTPVTDWPRMRSQVDGHGRVICGGVGTSMPARTVTGVRGARLIAENVAVSPAMVTSWHSRPTPTPTEHCTRPTSPGRVTEMSARSMLLFHDPATTFQKNTDGDADCWPVDAAKVLLAPVAPGSRTTGML